MGLGVVVAPREKCQREQTENVGNAFVREKYQYNLCLCQAKSLDRWVRNKISNIPFCIKTSKLGSKITEILIIYLIKKVFFAFSTD